MSVKTKEIRVRISEDLHSTLAGIADRRGEKIADVVRRYLEESIYKDAVEDGLDHVSIVLRRTLQEVLKPHINRLAALNAKTGKASAQSAFMLLEVLKRMNLGESDYAEIWRTANDKAVQYIKRKDEQEDD